MDKKVVHLLTRATPPDKISAIEINGKYAVKSGMVSSNILAQLHVCICFFSCGDWTSDDSAHV